MDLIQFQNNLKSIDVWDLLTPILKKHETEFLDANREQLISGETNTGEMIRPKYTEDPYFKSRGQALGYARWKHKLEEAGQIPKPKTGTKHFTAPNFFITGVVHSNLKMWVTKEGLTFDAEGFGSGFDNKYKNIYGVAEKNRIKIINGDMVGELTKSVKEAMFKQ